ncbi:PH domain-containing protein [Blastomonas sp. AAP53]|uniref:PH domain-containing protein n=1 Tax=Blastomonas sp. AAP53 TaxID=1248760 RepID=UPI000306E011|nr:PH domain-containing protein [Blastomonas sp. AAP53]
MASSSAEFMAPDEAAANGLSAGLRPVERAYIHVIRIGTALFAVPLVIGAGVLNFALANKDKVEHGAILIPALALAAFIVVFLPQRRWRRWGYAHADEQLRVARGWLVRTDTIVPFRRIQHIDVAQGPIERLFGLASLTVHTAGTHNSIVTLPGLSRDDAEAMRDMMRLHIRREAE